MSNIKNSILKNSKKTADYSRSKSIDEINHSSKELNVILCKKCDLPISQDDLAVNSFVCPNCNYHQRISFDQRLKLVVDLNSWNELDTTLASSNPIDMPGYTEKIISLNPDRIDKAFRYGRATIKKKECIVGIMDTNYFMGSMGSVVGEKITRSFRTARDNKLPIIIFSASGGARMQEGTYSLFQMSKIMSEINNFQKDGLLYISVLTDPTTGGVAASFSMIADIIIAEPNSLIGFAGPRVIEQTTKSKLPDDFQSSLNVFHRGMVDMVVERNQLPTLLNKLLSIHNN